MDENEFFREATFRICGNLEFEIALHECLKYLKSFIPADMFHLTIYDRGLGAFRIIAVATHDEAKRVNIFIPLDDEGRKYVEEQEPHPAFIIDPFKYNPLTKTMSQVEGVWREHSVMVMHLKVKGARPGNLILYAKGEARFTDKHLRLFSILNEPFTIALSNALRYDELIHLKEIMEDDIRYLHQKLHRPVGEIIIGEDFGLRKVLEMVKDVAPLDSPVLLLGETGVGKEIVANSIHNSSRRKNGPYIQVNCGAIPDTLIDSELFGHEKGAFTGAIEQKRGCFERADKGTIFLDEIAELPLQAQVRMLRVLQDKKILRVGGTSQIDVDIRIIAATHQNLEEMVKKGLFRSDLWFRLNVFPIIIPPLRERIEDIPALVNFFIEEKSKELGIPMPPKLALGSIDILKAYSWPGNIRELENVIERALILNRNGPLIFNDILLPEEARETEISDPGRDEFPPLDSIMSDHIKKALMFTKGRIHGSRGAADLLGINPSTLRHRMRKLGIPQGRGKY